MDVLKIIQNFIGIEFGLLDIVADQDDEPYNIIETLHHAREENLIQACESDDTVPCAAAASY